MPIRPKKPKTSNSPKPDTVPAPLDPNELRMKCPPEKTQDRALVDLSLSPVAAAMTTAQRYNKGTYGELSITDTFDSIRDQVATFEAGDHSAQRALLIGQSISLNAIFTEMARRAHVNFPNHFDASERMLRLALKAQAQSRATVEALDRLTNGHEQTVRHVHVDNRGGQAVIAETVHTGGLGNGNGKNDTQPHAQGAFGSALPSPDPLGNAVPIPSRKRMRACRIRL